MIEKAAATAIVLVAVIAIRLAARQAVRRARWSNGDDGRRWLVLVRNASLVLGPGHVRTGRTVSVPNSALLSTPVFNETAGHKYILHSFVIKVAGAHWREAVEVIGEAAIECSRPYAAPVRSAMEERARRHSLPLPSTEPLVFGQPDEGETILLTVRVPVDAAEAGRVERSITERWLDHLAVGADGTTD